MTTESEIVEPTFNLDVQLTSGASLQLPVSITAPLFIVGPNGAGKSGLILSLYQRNINNAIRISAHRQTWMESNFVPFSPMEKSNQLNNARNWDSQPNARWVEMNPSYRSGLVISELIEADNVLSRQVRVAVKSGNSLEATSLAEKLAPLETINELFNAAGIPIKMTIESNSSIFATKRDGNPYSIAALSDGERAALLIAGMILTAKSHSLILVDEPERHLHASIVIPLLSQLFARRPDCAFIVSTHELRLPVSCANARVALLRDSKTSGDVVASWDVDVLESGIDIDDDIKEAIIGSRRKMLFIEGSENSLDKSLYQILFPGVSIFPRQTCSDVEHAVCSIRDTSTITWVQAYGIVDQDQLNSDKKLTLRSKGIFALSVYSVESLYYNRVVVECIAKRQCTVLGGDPAHMVIEAWTELLATITSSSDRLAARMTEQAVKDRVSLGMLDWKQIQAGVNVSIQVDAQAYYQLEKAQLQRWITSKDVDNIMARYPIRETSALNSIVKALQFRNRTHYESAVRKLVTEDMAVKAALIANFGDLPAALA